MPYSKEYDKEKHSLVEKHIEKLNSLPKGKILVVSTSSEDKAQRLTWLFHDYLNVVGCKGIYFVKTICCDVALGRRGERPTLKKLVSADSGKDLASAFSSIIQELITSPSPRHVLTRLVEDENYSFTALSIILRELGRVMEE